MILVIISSFPLVSTLQVPQKVMAQVSTSDGAKVLIDDALLLLFGKHHQYHIL
jgi:hypothetical protein